MSPHLGASVLLLSSDGEAFPSNVLFSSGQYVHVGVPETWGARKAPEGVPFDLTWPGDKGVHVQPVVANEKAGTAGNAVWHLEPAGDYRFEQRRRYVRVPMRTLMTIANLHSPDAESEKATLIDVSEASLQCATSDLSWLDASHKTPVRVRFTVAESEFVTNGVVLRVTLIGTSAAPKGARIVIEFEDRPEFTDRLRRAVFEEQRRQIMEERERNERWASLQ